jgi:hypothetical protein
MYHRVDSRSLGIGFIFWLFGKVPRFFFLVVVVLFLFGRWLSHSTRDIRSPGETLDGLLAALSYYFFSLSLLLYLKSLNRETSCWKTPHCGASRNFSKTFFFFFFKPSFVLWPPKIWFKSYSVWSTREATTTTTTKIENQRYARISKNTKSWNTFETFLIRLHSPSQKKGL